MRQFSWVQFGLSDSNYVQSVPAAPRKGAYRSLAWWCCGGARLKFAHAFAQTRARFAPLAPSGKTGARPARRASTHVSQLLCDGVALTVVARGWATPRFQTTQETGCWREMRYESTRRRHLVVTRCLPGWREAWAEKSRVACPISAAGQRKRPFSSRLAQTHSPLPSLNNSFKRLRWPFENRNKQKQMPALGLGPTALAPHSYTV